MIKPICRLTLGVFVLLYACTPDLSDLDYGVLKVSKKGCNDSIPVLINEFVAKGSQQINEFGTAEDWIELYNNSDTTLRFTADQWFITDDLNKPQKYALPACEIPPRGFLVIWADGLNRVASHIHTNFNLSGSGEAIGLFYLNPTVGTPIMVDGFSFGEQASGMSQGRFPDGCNQWRTFPTPTIGESNKPE